MHIVDEKRRLWTSSSSVLPPRSFSPNATHHSQLARHSPNPRIFYWLFLYWMYPAQAILAAQRCLRKRRDGRGPLLTVCPPVRSAETLTPSPIARGRDCTARSKAACTP